MKQDEKKELKELRNQVRSQQRELEEHRMEVGRLQRQYDRDRKEDIHIHHWHYTGKVLPVYPAAYEQMCCWCGRKRTINFELVADKAACGPHLPDGALIERVKHGKGA